MVDLRINVVWASCEHDAAGMIFFEVVNDFLALSAQISSHIVKLLPSGIDSLLQLVGRKLGERLLQRLQDQRRLAEGHERIFEHNLAASDCLHIILDIF